MTQTGQAQQEALRHCGCPPARCPLLDGGLEAALEPFMEEPRNHQQRNMAVQPMWRTAAAPGQLDQPMQRQDRMCY
ncbi:unnamed protein product [Gadus morhua 'NCC']